MGWHSGNAAQAPKSGKKAPSALAQATWQALTGSPTETGSHCLGCFPRSESARLLTRKGRRVPAPCAGHSLAPGRQGWALALLPVDIWFPQVWDQSWEKSPVCAHKAGLGVTK